MEWAGRGLLTIGLVWFFTATMIGGARSLIIGATLFVVGAFLMMFH